MRKKSPNSSLKYIGVTFFFKFKNTYLTLQSYDYKRVLEVLLRNETLKIDVIYIVQPPPLKKGYRENRAYLRALQTLELHLTKYKSHNSQFQCEVNDVLCMFDVGNNSEFCEETQDFCQ